MKAKRIIQTPVLVSVSFLTRIKILFGWKVFFMVETGYAIHEPKAIGVSSRFAVVPPWIASPKQVAGADVPQGLI